ncbi:hypothetical protein CALCODRAFT_555805 [Calocera cornea HHB12733]|uniref:Uncharacterized protein n=1 Tax=Calocera cornea HHB12733 TaxID=1353952 RepID=A0A165FES7_9BASI|nr:hypothetical protein CALCODRAFT_555805 [Calocera cornea HHB12733]
MSAFDALTNLIQTIHDPPETFVLISHVSNYSWQLKLFLIASELKCYASTKREEISRDRKLVAGDKEAAFKDWKTLAEFIGSKIVAGDLHVAGWGSATVELIVDPGRPSALTIPLTELDRGDAAATATDLIYMIANEARQYRRCALIPLATPAPGQVELSPASTSRSAKSDKNQQAVELRDTEDEELARLKAELAAKENELARERAKPKAENARKVAAPPKAVAGASTAMPGHARRVVKRAQFSDDEDEEEAPIRGQTKLASASKAVNKNPEPASTTNSKTTKPPPAPPKRIVKRAEFTDDDEDEGKAVRAKPEPEPRSSGGAVASSSKSGAPLSQTKAKARAAAPVKRVVRRAEFGDEEDEEDDGAPQGKKRKT